MIKVVYLEDRKVGVHVYCSEMGEREPQTPIKARLGHYGTHYYLTTQLELKGRGIKKLDDNKYQVNNPMSKVRGLSLMIKSSQRMAS